MTASETGNDLQTLRRREKRQLAGACFFAALFLSVLIGVMTVAASNTEEAARLTAAGAPEIDIARLKVNTVAWLNVAGFGAFVGLLGLVICLLNWDSARRRRRKESAGLPPAAPP